MNTTLKPSKTRKLIEEIEKRGTMSYTEIQYFVWNCENVINLRTESKPSRGYWSTNIGRLFCSEVIFKNDEGRYYVKPGSSNLKTFYTTNHFVMSWHWEVVNKIKF